MPHRKHSLGKRRVALLGGFLLCFTVSVNLMIRRSDDPLNEAILDLSLGGTLLPLLAGIWLAGSIVCLANMRYGKLILPLSLVCGLMAGWGTTWMISFINDAFIHGVFVMSKFKQAVVFWGPLLIIGSLVALTPRSPESTLKDDIDRGSV